MKKLVFILILLTSGMHLTAQNEVDPDNTSTSTPHYKQFGDFILDMSFLAAPPKLPSFSENLLGPDMTKDYNQLFQLPGKWSVSKSFVTPTYMYGINTHSSQLQSATFRLNDNMRITTYGQYNLNGRRLPNPSALPWEKNNFMGGMELKVNKNFGIRVEVQRH